MTDNKHPKHETSLFIVKPDGVQRGLIGEIMSRFERKGLKVAAAKLVKPTMEQAREHYSSLDEAWCKKVGGYVKAAYDEQGLDFTYESELEAGKAVKKSLVGYLSCGPIMVILIQGAHAVTHVRKLLGSTNPLEADIGTIRGDFTVESIVMANSFDRTVRNIAHASESVEEAERETKVWFEESEIVKYDMAIDNILYDPTWDKIGDENLDI
jgi:nucleoside-diphosphate kinase